MSYCESSKLCRATAMCLCCLLLDCGGNGSPKPDEIQLTLVTSYALDVDEPSGLTVNATGTSLWVAGNNPERVYRLSPHGEVLDRLEYKGEDLEGIAWDPTDGTLWVVEEERREVVHLDADGRVLARRQLDLTGNPNNGLEGICLDSGGTVHVVNEMDPGLFVSLDDDLSMESWHTLDFADDYSGLDCHRPREGFWVLSHQDRMLFLWSPETGVTGAFPLPMDKPEGVAVDTTADLVYIAAELEERLYVYSIEYPE